ncbi:uncharacterized protein LOC142344378 isoform X2 [Convolutriloba macropyga]|uniref:uncharacterized protein LOC142344378 isoform X2 n=1 Tax=Convolutriloba macropyga TaxID=536237 RepID=UPI003F5242D4
MEFQQVFLSHCVRSAGVAAKSLDDMVREKGMSTFICVDMEAGDGFREAIVGNAANCKVMVLFMDEQWANSKECKSEFNCAYSCFNRSEWPKFVPIVLGGFNWIKPTTYPTAHCITSNFQCLMLDADQSKWSGLFDKVIDRCRDIVEESKEEIVVDSSGSTMDASKKPPPPASPDNPPEKPSSQLLSAIAAFVSCEICQNIFRDPRRLPCSHTFCYNCLIKWKKETEPEPFCCPKCRFTCSVEIEKLPADLKAAQMVKINEILQKNAKTSQSQSAVKLDASVTPNVRKIPMKFPRELKEWFASNLITSEAQRVLFDDGFEYLDIIMDMTIDDIDKLGLKTGHKRKLWKCLQTSRGDAGLPEQSPFRVTKSRPKANPDIEVAANSSELFSDPGWIILDNIYDERVLMSGTQPVDSLKFWASLGQKQRNEFIYRFKSLGESLKIADETQIEEKEKSEKLRKIAMVLCDAGQYSDSESYADEALQMIASSTEGYHVTKVLHCYAMMWKLKLPTFVSKDRDELAEWNSLLEELNELIRESKDVLSKEMLIKVYIMKVFAVLSINLRDRDPPLEATEDIKAARELCAQVDDKGLLAELLNNEASYDPDNAVKNLYEARKLCLDSYGEFSVLMQRIYYNFACQLEAYDEYEKLAYQCFRRVWLINRQINGQHHPETLKAASILTDDEECYKAIAQEIGDSLPSDELLGAQDMDYVERLKGLDDAVKVIVNSSEE